MGSLSGAGKGGAQASPDEPLPGHAGDPALVGEGQVPVRVAQGQPGDVDRLVVGVVLDREVATDRLEQVVVDVLVDPPLAGGEPVVDGAELDEHAPLDAGLLGDLARRGLGQGLLALDVALGQAPLDAAGPVAAGDHGDARLALVDVDDDPTGAALLDRRQPPGGHPGRVCGGMAHLVTVASGPQGRPGTHVAAPARAGGGARRHTLGARAHPSAPGRPAAAGGRPPRARAAPAHRPRRAVRGGGTRARPRRRAGARRVPRPDGADLDFTTSARPDETEALLAAWGTRTGTSAGSSARSGPAAAAPSSR